MVTVLSPNTLQSVSLTDPSIGLQQSYRYNNPYLLNMTVPQQLNVPVASPAPVAGGYGGGGYSGGAAAPVGMCSLGQTRCVAGWLGVCESVGASTMWKTGARHC